jgi:hypothetical protein
MMKYLKLSNNQNLEKRIRMKMEMVKINEDNINMFSLIGTRISFY